MHLEPEKDRALFANNLDVPIIYQDKHLAVVHKPVGMTVHPGAGTGDDTLVHSLLAQLETLSDGSEPERPGIVHRLDRETEGLLVVARTNEAHFKLARAFEERQAFKQYAAWVWGSLEPANDRIDGFIGRSPANRKKMVFKKEQEKQTDREARMRYQIAKNLNELSLVNIVLETGRTHQIRASLAHQGTPVIGDELYGRQNRRLRRLKPEVVHQLKERGMLLIAQTLGFIHPITLQELKFELPLPERFDLQSVFEH